MESGERAVPPTETYRMLARNVAIVVLVVLVVGYAVVRNWYSADHDGYPIRWWSLPVIVVGVGVVVVRLLRSAVIVGPHGITNRTVGYTGRHAWRDLAEVKVSTTESGRATLRATRPSAKGPKHYLEVRVGKGHRAHTPFATAVQRAIDADAAGPSAHEDASPHPVVPGSPRWVVYGLWTSLAVIVIGSQVFEGALRDRDAYEARAARDRVTMASVISSEIVEDDHGEGDPTYSTRVGIVFDAVHRHVKTVIKRSGRHRFPSEAAVEVVYDSARPRDADFSDRPNRSANESSASLRLWVGPTLAILGVLAAAALLVARWRPLDRHP